MLDKHYEIKVKTSTMTASVFVLAIVVNDYLFGANRTDGVLVFGDHKRFVTRAELEILS